MVTYPINRSVWAAFEHAEHMTLEQIEARIMEIEAEEDPLPGDRGVREAAVGCDVLQEVQPVEPRGSCRTMESSLTRSMKCREQTEFLFFQIIRRSLRHRAADLKGFSPTSPR